MLFSRNVVSRMPKFLLAIAVFSGVAGLGGPALAQAPALPTDYVDLYRQVVARQSPQKHYKLYETLALGDAHVRLWRRTQDPVFLTAAERYFAAAWGGGEPDLRDFHSLMMFARLALLLKQEGRIPPDREKAVRTIAERELRSFVRSEDNGDYNIRIAQVLAYASCLEYLQDAAYADREAARQRLTQYWSLICQTGDLDEDATNYDSFGMALLVDLARLIGREEDLKRSAGFRRVFDRFRDVVSPAGLMPEYGDSFFSTSQCLLDRVYLMEYAAKIYDDPTFLHAARKLYRRPGAAFPECDLWFRALPLINLDVSPAEPRQPGGVSLVTFRARRGQTQPLVDKLILRTGLEPGSAMVMMDLYAAGSHAHQEKGPSIAYFESGGVPLFHNMGRHGAQSAITGNLLWAMPAQDRFPGCWNREDQWFTMSIPTQYLQGDGRQFAVAPVMLLRNFQERSRSCRELCFANLRLEGPAGTRLIDGFDDPARWDARLRRLSQVALEKDASQGTSCEHVAWQAVPSEHIARKLASPGGSFTRDDYHYLKLDLKYRGGRPMMHIRGLGRQVDLGDQLLMSQLRQARVEQRNRDAYGEMAYSDYVTPDTGLVRRLVLTAEGCLVVFDVLVPGRSMQGWNAGQLWQFYQQRAAGKDWFLSEDDGYYPAANGAPQARRMLVRFAAQGPVTMGSQQVQQSYHCPNPNGRKAEAFFTTFSCASVAPGTKQRFAMIVVPENPEDAQESDLAPRVGVGLEADGTAVAKVRGRNGRNVQVRIGEAAWNVTRPSALSAGRNPGD